MLDPTFIRRRFYKKLNIPGMDGFRNSRPSPADSGVGGDSIPSPVSECSEVSSDTMTRTTSNESVFEKSPKTSHDGPASPSLKVPSVPKVSFQRNYHVRYLGGICLDRRYTQPMLPWIVADLRREGLKQPTDVLLEVRDSSLRASLYSEEKVLFEHPLSTISKFAKVSVDHTCFTYLQKDGPDVPPQCHVFQATDEETVLELFVTVREVTKELASHKQGGMSPLCRMGSGTGLEAFLSNAQQFEVLYVGRVKGSSKHSSHTFLDDAVDRFKAKQQEQVTQQKQMPNGSLRACTFKVSGTAAAPGANGLSAQVTKGLEVGACRSSSENISSPSSEFSSLENISEVSGTEESPHHDKGAAGGKEGSVPVALVTHSQSLDPEASEALLENLKGSCTNKCGITRDTLVPPSPHTLITHTHSLDAQSRQSVIQDLQNEQLTSPRVRSISGDIPRPAKQTSLPTYRSRTSSGGSVDLRRPLPECVKRNNRTMLFLILKKELCLLSTDRKQVLVSKNFSDISRCYLGVSHPDHFGFNCRDASTTSTDNYIAYIFKCSTVEVANEIMQTMKQAFNSAHQSHRGQPSKEQPSGFLQNLCDSCPMHKFHKLCLELEGLSPEDSQRVIRRRISHLSDPDRHTIQAKYQGAEVKTVQEGNEVHMMLLRSLYERKQQKHTHQPHQGPKQESLLDIKAPSFTFDNLKEKAKKSLSNSFDTILKRKGKEVEARGRSATLPSEAMFKLTMNDSSPTGGSLASSREGSCDPSVAAYRSSSKEQTPSPQLQRPRSSTFSTTREARAQDSVRRTVKNEAAVSNSGNKRSPIVNIFMKVGSSRHHSSSDEDSVEMPNHNASWRQAIFERVHTPSKDSDASACETPAVIRAIRDGKPRTCRTREELRDLWKTAIKQQILLIRMEKENRKLQEHQDEASNKRIRLDYEEVTPCIRDTAQLWDELLTSEECGDRRINPDVLQDMVKAGVPRYKRGEIWQLLAEQYKLRWPPATVTDVDTTTSFQQLLNELTVHQHAILIDLGRTFPNHPFYKECLGAGQMSLYNLLKAYSLLDTEVGYCQGLSFVSGVLLLHMSEEEAFEMMKHFLFYLGFRKQYKPDMVALQVQLYQLYRLVHDHYRDLYQHFEKHDISPALFAAPWFLTLFASQFPLGFVSRLFDVIFLQGMEAVFKVGLALLGSFADTLMACSSFEAIMDCFKNKLPSLDVIHMEKVFTQVFSLDISKQLLAYEVEYHLIQEEMLYTPRKDSISTEELETNRSLRRQNMELLEQLQVANNNVSKLEATVTSYQGTVKHLEDRIRRLEDERDALLHSNNILRHRVERLECNDSNPGAEVRSRPPSLGAARSLSFGAGETAEGIASMVRQLCTTGERDDGDAASSNSDERVDSDEQAGGGL